MASPIETIAANVNPGRLRSVRIAYRRSFTTAFTDSSYQSSLTSRLDSWRADADASRGFVERRVERFRVMFQGQVDKPLASRATDLLESAFWRIDKVLGAYPSDAIGTREAAPSRAEARSR
jgi:hypothetical protein